MNYFAYTFDGETVTVVDACHTQNMHEQEYYKRWTLPPLSVYFVHKLACCRTCNTASDKFTFEGFTNATAGEQG